MMPIPSYIHFSMGYIFEVKFQYPKRPGWLLDVIRSFMRSLVECMEPLCLDGPLAGVDSMPLTKLGSLTALPGGGVSWALKRGEPAKTGNRACLAPRLSWRRENADELVEGNKPERSERWCIQPTHLSLLQISVTDSSFERISTAVLTVCMRLVCTWLKEGPQAEDVW